MDGMKSELKIIEALLFVENNAVSVKRFASVLKLNADEVHRLVGELNDIYKNNGHSLYIQRLEDSYELALEEVFARDVFSSYLTKKKKLPKGLMETLMIIAYKQPITRVEIETIRGVNTTSYIKQLLSEGFIEEAGRKETVGNPLLYRTTHKFLVHFSLSSLEDLPPLSEVKQYEFLS